MPREEPAPPSADPAERNRDQSFRHEIEEGVSISGKIHFPHNARVDGKLKGEIRADELLLVGPTAEIEATICARKMILAGRLVGDVVRSGRVELADGAEVRGDIQARYLVVQSGACFEGSARIGVDVEPRADPRSRKEA